MTPPLAALRCWRCGGYGTVALGPDPYWPCPECNGSGENENKVREEIRDCPMCGDPRGYGHVCPERSN
jgi:hypothetical protein